MLKLDLKKILKKKNKAVASERNKELIETIQTTKERLETKKSGVVPTFSNDFILK